jgi:exopolyphosphatase/guanosine-5'-triphosphate,3'-diphosphate pyrophosphatase
MIVGAIDVGTNAARLSVAKLSLVDGSVSIERVFYSRVPLRLGKDVFEKGKLSKKKAEQFVKTMHAFRLLADVHGVEQLRAVATSAMREASNAQETTQLIQETTGIDLEVISGEEEALLIFESFDFLGLVNQPAYIVVDVGGGSTEVSIFENGKRRASRSFNLGTLRLSNGSTTAGEWHELRIWLVQEVDLSIDHAIYGTGGNIRKVHDLLDLSDNEAISTVDMYQLHSKMKTLTIDERQKEFRLKADRAEVIVPAMAIFLAVLNTLNASSIYAPKLSLSDGIMLHAFRQLK